MTIEIHGAGFRNKGAELMLRTAIAEIRKRLPEAEFAIDPTVGSYTKRAKLGLRQIVPPRWWMGSRRFRFGLMAQRALSPILTSAPFRRFTDMYGGTAISEIDALVDVSGFAFTDQWGTDPIRDFARLSQTYKKNKKPVLMLPQGFGPFDKPESEEAMSDLISVVDQAYARDDISLRHVRSVAPEPQSVKKAPDITLFYPKIIKSIRHAENASYSCIIPNVRMLDQGKDEWGDRYEDILRCVGNLLHSSGERVYFLIHDISGKDEAIARRVGSAMKSTPEIVQKEDPIALKNFVAESRLVVTSRYHGAVASFSKAVPSVCLGWAHKYEMLYRDFGCPSHMIYPDTTIDDIKEKLRLLVDSSTNNQARRNIFKALTEMSNDNALMWNEVTNRLMEMDS